jgi:phosphatidylglycerol lysyltransferase
MEPVSRAGLMLIIFFASLWLLHHEFESVRYAEVVSSFRAISWTSIATAVALTAANFVVLIGYDWFGVRLVEHPVSTKQVAAASLLSYAFSNTLGVFLGGAPVRARLYSSFGMSSPEIVRLVLVIGVAFWLGLFSLAGLLFVVAPFDLPPRFHLPLANSRPLGIALLALAGLFLAICVIRRNPLPVWGVNLQPPPLRIALAQMLTSYLDFLLAAGVLYVLLPSDVSIGFLSFTAVFLLAVFVALASHIPGGLGVLELVLVTMLPGDPHGLVGALIAFRIIYYLLPLLIALIIIAILSLRKHRGHLTGAVSGGVRWANVIGPTIITGAVFIAGVALLISGALPAAAGRIDVLRDWVPLSVVELSHFFGSVIGALLIVLARGLQRRIDAAWWLTLGLLAAGFVSSLLRGFAYEEAALLGVLFVGMLPCRSYFYRQGRLLSPSWSVGWLSAIAMTIGAVAWLLLFSYRHVDYSNDLWWRFAFSGEAPRSMRASVAAAVVIGIAVLMQLLRTKIRLPEAATPDELRRIEAIVEKDERTSANLALLGDKRFVFSEDGEAFVMFGGEGNSWISMGDPIGPRASADDAAWRFREACDEQGVWSVFYQVDESSLSRYIEMGLSMLKLGEEARVPLADFSLEGSSRKDLRRTSKRAAEAGLRFEILPRRDVADRMPELKAISDAWLGEKSAGEKGFSLGFFDETYLMHYDFGLVVQGDRPIAFANIWKGGEKRELSIDLMRYLPDAQSGVMEYLFTNLMLYGRQEGYEWFSLGMSPLSGVDAHRLGPTWNRVSSLLYRHGEHFYNFQGLRHYKNKFRPQWSPKYLASPGGIATPQILANVSTLISGGVVKLIRR